MDDGIDELAGEHPADARAIADVRDDERDGRIEVRAVAGREVVEHDDVVVPGAEGVDDVRSEEPGAAGDEDAHPTYPLSMWTVLWTPRWMARTSEPNLGRQRSGPGG